MKAIIYTSNTGSEIIYLGWIMAGGIKGYKEAAKLYKMRAVCGVGMGQTGTQLKEVRDKNTIPQRIPLFTLQGNFDVKKLHDNYIEKCYNKDANTMKRVRW